MTSKYLLSSERESSLVSLSAIPTNHSREIEPEHSAIGEVTASRDRVNLESLLKLDVSEMNAYQVGLVRVGDLSTGDCSTSALRRPQSVLVLPFTWNEFLTSMRSEVREKQLDPNDGVVRFGIATADFHKMEAFRSEQPVALTRTQFKVLHYFVLHPGRVISRDELLNKVWGYDNYPTTRTVDNTLLRLRQAFEPVPAEPVHFRTVHRAGYKFIP